MTILGLIHPGAMGASIGAAAVAAGTPVAWASAGRSAASAQRAAALVARCEVVVSVCPPGAAHEVAGTVAALGFDGVYVDANAVAPATVRGIGAAIERGGARFVDGGIVGPPARQPGSTRLYLAGAEAGAVAALFEGSVLGTVVIGDEIGRASALKMAYAARGKGASALLLAVRAFARAEGVERELLDEWAISLPEMRERSDRTAQGTAPKAWRFSGEMLEIADSFEVAGLPGGFHHAAATLYARLSGFKDVEGADPEAVVDALLAGEESS
jgi:3-hydroxyisobutyrate dehydrogenase-like beta-hydroxyacid dehydrogenase